MMRNFLLYQNIQTIKKTDDVEMTWIQCDIFHYEQVVAAMNQVDIAVFFIDPTKNSAKITQSSARDLTLIAADNFGRAAAINQVKKSNLHTWESL